MKKFIKIKFLSAMCCTLIVISYACSTNNTSNVKIQERGIVDTISKPKTTESAASDNEVIGGWLKESIEQKIVLEKLGSPSKKGIDEYWGALGTYVQNWEYITLGIILEMESEKQGEVKRVLSITITKPCNLTTSKGISIGSDEKTVREKYFKLIDASNPNPKIIVVGTIYGGTIFTIENGVVNKIYIGAAAE